MERLDNGLLAITVDMTHHIPKLRKLCDEIAEDIKKKNPALRELVSHLGPDADLDRGAQIIALRAIIDQARGALHRAGVSENVLIDALENIHGDMPRQ